MSEKENTQNRYDHNMIGYESCYENKHILTCHDSDKVTDQVSDQVKNRISKEEWNYLVDTLTKWRVYSPRTVVKKNPAAAWRCMNLCKDKGVRVPGAYFTACFRTELAKANFVSALEKKCGVA